MLVYRIEDADGGGIYRGYSGRSWDYAHDDMKHPLPYEDSLLAPLYNKLDSSARSNYIYGFSSIQQLRSWIYADGWLLDMHDAGFKLSIYNVTDEVLMGHTQVMFLRSEAVERHDLMEYFNLTIEGV